MPNNPYGWILVSGIIALIVISVAASFRSRAKWLKQERRLAILAALYPDRALTGAQICKLVPTVNASAIYQLLDGMEGREIAMESLVPSSGNGSNRAKLRLHRLTEVGHKSLRSRPEFNFLTRPGKTVGH